MIAVYVSISASWELLISFVCDVTIETTSTSDGAGTIISQDSFLRVGFYGLKQANGFIYTLGDSSINTISGVATSTATPPVTTFSNQNVDPQIASAIGQAIGKPELAWVEFTDEQALGGMLQAGLPEEVAKNYVEMGGALRSGKMSEDYWKRS